jgi:hypothetical protein
MPLDRPTRPVIPIPQRRVHLHLARYIVNRSPGHLPNMPGKPGLDREKFQDQRKTQPSRARLVPHQPSVVIQQRPRGNQLLRLPLPTHPTHPTHPPPDTSHTTQNAIKLDPTQDLPHRYMAAGDTFGRTGPSEDKRTGSGQVGVARCVLGHRGVLSLPEVVVRFGWTLLVFGVMTFWKVVVVVSGGSMCEEF